MCRSFALSLGLAWAALASLTPEAAAVTITVIGATGAPDIIGPDGSAGGDGGSATAVADAPDPQNTATARAGRGGYGVTPGGAGGDGGSASATASVDSSGNDSNRRALALAVGGAGGNGADRPNFPGPDGPPGAGGRGGDATVRASLVASGDATVIVGSPFQGFGTPTGGAHAGDGGSLSVITAPQVPAEVRAGDGGHADSESTALVLGDAVLRMWDVAVGGDGGRSNTLTYLGGAGGDASSLASGRGEGSGSVTVSATALGGNSGGTNAPGGVGVARAHGESAGGGEVDVSAVQSTGGVGSWTAAGDAPDGADSQMLDAVSGSTSGLLRLQQSARAGGGFTTTTGGASGNGGAAESSLMASNPGGGALDLRAEAEGGLGGYGGSFGTPEGGTAGTGGLATVSAIGSDAAGAELTVTADAKGGQGGNALTGSAGDGGGVGFGAVYGGSTAGGTVRVTAIGRGGTGGEEGGDGAPMTLVDVVDGDTSSVLELTQLALGGLGGNRSYLESPSGQPGAATSSLTRAKSAASLLLVSEAWGGDTGQTFSTPPAIGADASALVEASNDAGSVEARALAHGGRGLEGGAARVQAFAHTEGDDRAVRVGGELLDPLIPAANFGALGGTSFDNAEGDAGDGGDAISESRGEAAGDSSVEVVDVAIGGISGDLEAGGDGGDARSHAEGRNAGLQPVQVTAFARGGEVQGETGGRAGVAEATASGSSSGGGDVTVAAIQVGGSANPYASGGQAASSQLVDAVSGSTAGLLMLSQLAVGGDGGGLAPPGEGRSILEAVNPGGGGIALFSEGRGGNGAGSGFASAISETTNGAPVLVSALARGGAGGAFDPLGGDGATAQLGAVRGTSSGGGDVTVIGEVVGGDGGGSSFSGSVAGGRGASIVLVDAVEGATSGSLMLVQRARGGAAGWATQGDAGAAGSARSALARRQDADALEIVAEAYGGLGGYVVRGPGSPTGGANAEVEVEAENGAGSATARGRASGGSGGTSSDTPLAANGGDASAVFAARTTGDGHRVVVGSSDGTPYGAFGGDNGFQEAQGSGGSAHSRSSGIAAGASQVEVFDQAVGGLGGSSAGARGGDASSTGFGSTASAESVSVNALARGGMIQTGSGIAGDAEARATAIGLGSTEANATSESGFGTKFALFAPRLAGLGHAHALAEATGASARASAAALSNGPGFAGATAIASAVGGGSAVSETGLAFGNAPAPSPAQGVQAASLALGAPDAAAVSGALAGNPNVAVGLSGADPIALATLGGGKSESVGGGVHAISASLNLALAAGGFGGSATQSVSLAIGFLDPIAAASGFDSLSFDILVDDQSVLSESFTDLALATSFLDDHLIDLGIFAHEISSSPFRPNALPIDLRIQLELMTEDPGASFFTTLVVARTAVVPEPGTAALVALGLLLLRVSRGRFGLAL